MSAPGSALSAAITFRRAASDGSDVSFVAEQPVGSAASIQTYLAPAAVRPQTAVLVVDFHTESQGSGSAVANATASVSIGKGGVLRRPDGTSLGNVGFVGAIDGISIAPDGVDAGSTTELVETVTANGGVLAVSPGSIMLQVTSGAERLRAEGGTTVTGLTEGTATVVATIDGVSSAPTTIEVNGPALAARTVDLVASKLVYDPTRGKIWAALPGAGDSGNAIVALDPATGARGTRIPVGLFPTTMTITDDGAAMFVGLQGDGTVRRIDLATGIAGAPFTLVPPSPFGEAAYALDLAAVPGSNVSVAAALGGVGSSGTYGPYIYDAGVRRPSGPQLYGGNRIVFTSPTRLVATNPGFSPQSLFDCHVDAQGVTLQREVRGPFQGWVMDVVASGDRLYASDGSILDSETFNRLGSFLDGRTRDYWNHFYGPAVDEAAGRVYFVSVIGDQVRLLGFRADTFAPVLNRRITGIDAGFAEDQGGGNLIRYGSSGLAFLAGGRVAFVDGLPGG